MKLLRPLLPLLLALAWAQSAHGVSVTNGDFGTGDFTGWTLDTDGFPGTANDFQVVGSPGDYRAEIHADYWSTPGDIASTPLNDVFVANTLYQELDTALSPGAMMRLTFDWVFTTEDGDPVAGDVFTAALHDGLGNLYSAEGTIGYLVYPKSNSSSGTFSALLDTTTFADSSGWLLEFQLTVGVDGSGMPNGLGSTARIANIEFIEVTETPISPSSSLLAFGLLLLLGVRRALGSWRAASVESDSRIGVLQ